MRQVVVDTETTGLDPTMGHRIIEIGAIELINQVATETKYHCYINPEREIDQGAFEVHGLSEEYLKKFSTFDKIADAFLEFISDDPLIIHNAPFDISFLNAELRFFGLSKVELLITKPSILFAKLINAISLVCSSLLSGEILKKIGILAKLDVFLFLSLID